MRKTCDKCGKKVSKKYIKAHGWYEVRKAEEAKEKERNASS